MWDEFYCSVSSQEKTMLTNMTHFMLLFVILACSIVSTCAKPGHTHERFIIHAPIKFETIHHYKIHKIPVHIKKHVHHHKYIEHHDNHDHHDHHDLHDHPSISDDFLGHDRYDYVDDDHGHYDDYGTSDEHYYK